MKTVPLTKGYVALVDDEDYERVLAAGPWHAMLSHGKVYGLHKNRQSHYLMHRFILGLTDPKLQGDHKDGDGLNNQKYNLRIATHAQNQHNKTKPINNTSGVTGVSWHKRSQRWRVDITVNNKSRTIGTFKSFEEAVEARKDAAIKLHKEFAYVSS
jgi:hypothetical protein